MCLGNSRTQQCLEDFIWHLALGSGIALYQAFRLYLRNSVLGEDAPLATPWASHSGQRECALMHLNLRERI